MKKRKVKIPLGYVEEIMALSEDKKKKPVDYDSFRELPDGTRQSAPQVEQKPSEVEKNKWIEFEELIPPDELTYYPKTKRWVVQTKDYIQLGMIKWNCGWRKYAFYPYSDNIFEQACLRDIAKFIEEKTKEHKKVGKL